MSDKRFERDIGDILGKSISLKDKAEELRERIEKRIELENKWAKVSSSEILGGSGFIVMIQYMGRYYNPEVIHLEFWILFENGEMRKFERGCSGSYSAQKEKSWKFFSTEAFLSIEREDDRLNFGIEFWTLVSGSYRTSYKVGNDDFSIDLN